MVKSGEADPGRSRLWLGLHKLTRKEGVHRKDLRTLLIADLRPLAEHWGIDFDNEDSARSKLIVKLSEHIKEIRPIHPAHREIDPFQHIAQFRLIAAVGFNVWSQFDFSTWSLTKRQAWITGLRSKEGVKGYEKIWNFAVSQSTAQRDLRDAITRIEQIILSEGYVENLEPQASAVPEAECDVVRVEESSASGDENFETVAESLSFSGEDESTTGEGSDSRQHFQAIRGNLFDETPAGDGLLSATKVAPASLDRPKCLTAEDISFDVKLPPFEDYFTAIDADASLDALMLKAQTFPSRREAQAGMAQRFGLDDEPHEAYRDERATTEQVTHGIHCARENDGFGAKQQRKAAVALAGLPTGYRGLIDLHRTVYGVAGKDLAAVSKLFSGIAKAARKARRYDLAVEHKTHMYLYGRICEDGDLHLASAHVGYVEAIHRLEPWRIVGAPLYCVINVVNALAIELHRWNATSDTAPSGLQRAEAREESGRLAGLAERIIAFSVGAPTMVARVLADELIEGAGEVRATIKARVLEPWLTDIVVHDDGQGGVLFKPNTDYDEATRRGYLEQVRLHKMQVTFHNSFITVDLDE